MKKHIVRFSLLIVYVLSMGNALGQDLKLSAVANSKVPVKELTKSELKAYMKGQKARWTDKSKVVLAVMDAKTAIGEAAAKQLFNMSGAELYKHYLTLVFQGKISSPKYFQTEKELIEYVTNTDGAIGIISGSAAGGCNRIKIEGAEEF